MLCSFRRLSAPLAAIGLAINATKCQLWRNGAHQAAGDPGVPSQFVELSPLPPVVLGYPVAGNTEALGAFVRSAVDKATKAIDKVAKLHHAQGEAVVLRQCGPTNRLRHLLRFAIDEHTAA